MIFRNMSAAGNMNYLENDRKKYAAVMRKMKIYAQIITILRMM